MVCCQKCAQPHLTEMTMLHQIRQNPLTKQTAIPTGDLKIKAFLRATANQGIAIKIPASITT